MRIPENLQKAFGPGPEFETLLAAFAHEVGLLDDPSDLKSKRFLSRSVAPHILKLSDLFNRKLENQAAPLDAYWKKGNTAHLRLAYFLYFMPSNAFRVAAVWAELASLGYKWAPTATPFKGLELGAGPASGACGIAYGEKHAPLGLPSTGNWALIEQDKATLDLGKRWAERCFSPFQWDVRPFARKIDPKTGFLPSGAPRFSLWLMSFFLNELDISPAALAKKLIANWNQHVEREGLIILIEPALKLQSRRLLELRKELLKNFDGYQILLPCLGHQACGALLDEKDWCHEDVSWWRPPYFKTLDQMVGLDRKSLPFSYLVIAKTSQTREQLLPKLTSGAHRLVSPAHKEGRDLEFYICGQDGKRRARVRTDSLEPKEPVGRGDILLDAQIKGDKKASRIQSATRLT